MSKSIEQAETELANAKAAYLSELERDIERRDGSVRQERLREQRQQSLRDDVARCERVLEEARRLKKAD